MANENILSEKEISIKLKGAEYKIRPLPINELIEVWPIIEGLEDLKNKPVTVKVLRDMIKLAHIGLRAGGAEGLTEKQVGDMVDLVDLQKIIGAMVGQKDISKLISK